MASNKNSVPNDDKPPTPAQARQKLQKGLYDDLAGDGSEAIVFRLKRTKKGIAFNNRHFKVGNFCRTNNSIGNVP